MCHGDAFVWLDLAFPLWDWIVRDSDFWLLKKIVVLKLTWQYTVL